MTVVLKKASFIVQIKDDTIIFSFQNTILRKEKLDFRKNNAFSTNGGQVQGCIRNGFLKIIPQPIVHMKYILFVYVQGFVSLSSLKSENKLSTDGSSTFFSIRLFLFLLLLSFAFFSSCSRFTHSWWYRTTNGNIGRN